VKKVVTNHNGYTAAEGEPGKGATFRVLLPVAEKENKKEEVD
jgi:signal transduction histidine kinase